MPLTTKTLGLVSLMAVAALAIMGYAMFFIRPALGYQFWGYRFWALTVLALATARLKIKLPTLTGNMAVNLPFLLMAVAQLRMVEALVVALLACVVQCFPKEGGKPKPVQFLFNLSTTAVAVGAASVIGTHYGPLLSPAGFFLAQTVPLACIIHLTEGGPIHRIWSRIAHQCFPFYVLSAGMTSIAISTNPQWGWQVPLFSLPVLYAIYRSYKSYFHESKLQSKAAVLSSHS